MVHNRSNLQQSLLSSYYNALTLKKSKALLPLSCLLSESKNRVNFDSETTNLE